MTSPASKDWRELDRLIDRACDQALSAEELAVLGEWLVRDSEACDRYIAAMLVHARLAWHAQPGKPFSIGELTHYTQVGSRFEDANDEAVAAERVPSLMFLGNATDGAAGYVPAGWPVAYLVATLVVGISLLVGSYTYVSAPSSIADKTATIDGHRIASGDQGPAVGRIVGMSRCKLAGTSPKASLGARLPLGWKCELTGGLMEIAYDTGARVILQGPATYEVTSDKAGFLSVGRLTAKVENRVEEVVSGQWPAASHGEARHHPPSADPQSPISNPSPSAADGPLFSVATPTAIVTDLGTEFGVEVSREGRTVAQVFAGSVQVVEPNSRAAKILSVGDAIEVKDRTIRALDPKIVGRFLRSIPQTKTFRGLADDFNDNRLDLTKWRRVLPTLRSRLAEDNGQIEIISRGCLVTRRECDPDLVGGIKITGRWTFADLADVGEMMQIVTRSDATFTGEDGEINNGLEFFLAPHPSQETSTLDIGIKTHGPNLEIGEVSGGGTLTVSRDRRFTFEIIDSGAAGVSLAVADVADPANAAKITAVLTRHNAGASFIVFHNREKPNNVSHIDDIVIAPLGAEESDRGQSATQ